MVLDTLGKKVEVADLIKQTHVSPKGVTSKQIADLLTNNGAKARVRSKLSIDGIANATKKGKPCIVAVKEGGLDMLSLSMV